MKKLLSILAVIVALSITLVSCTEEEITPQNSGEEKVVEFKEPPSQWSMTPVSPPGRRPQW